MCVCACACVSIILLQLFAFFYMFSALSNICDKTVPTMEEQQGLCHLSLYCKRVFSNILHHEFLLFKRKEKSEYGDCVRV